MCSSMGNALPGILRNVNHVEIVTGHKSGKVLSIRSGEASQKVDITSQLSKSDIQALQNAVQSLTPTYNGHYRGRNYLEYDLKKKK